jgi:hypothetical protein
MLVNTSLRLAISPAPTNGHVKDSQDRKVRQWNRTLLRKEQAHLLRMTQGCRT